MDPDFAQFGAAFTPKHILLGLPSLLEVTHWPGFFNPVDGGVHRFQISNKSCYSFNETITDDLRNAIVEFAGEQVSLNRTDF